MKDNKVKLTVYLDKQEAEMFKRVTSEKEKSESEVGRELIVQYIERNL